MRDWMSTLTTRVRWSASAVDACTLASAAMPLLVAALCLRLEEAERVGAEEEGEGEKGDGPSPSFTPPPSSLPSPSGLKMELGTGGSPGIPKGQFTVSLAKPMRVALPLMRISSCTSSPPRLEPLRAESTPSTRTSTLTPPHPTIAPLRRALSVQAWRRTRDSVREATVAPSSFFLGLGERAFAEVWGGRGDNGAKGEGVSLDPPTQTH